MDRLDPEFLIHIPQLAGFGKEVPLPQSIRIDQSGDALAVTSDEEEWESSLCRTVADFSVGEDTGEGFDDIDAVRVFEFG